MPLRDDAILPLFDPTTPRFDVVLTATNDEDVVMILMLEVVRESEPEVTPESDVLLPPGFDSMRVVDVISEAIDDGEVIEVLMLELVSFWLD